MKKKGQNYYIAWKIVLTPFFLDRVAATRLLNQALENVPYHYAGQVTGEIAKTKPQAHHIVPVQLFEQGLGTRLHDMGIDLNGIENGVWLPTEDFGGRVAALHRGNHQGAIKAADGALLRSYVQEVEFRFQGVTTREKALEILNGLRDDLLNSATSGLKLYNEKIP